MTPAADALGSALLRILTPLARLLVARGLRYPAAAELLKAAYLAAGEAACAAGPPPTASRLSLLTGLQRKDLAALRAAGPRPRATGPGPLPRLLRLWRAAPYADEAGRPRVLPRQGPAPSFETLAAAATRDLHARTLLDELLRLGLVEATGAGLRLVAAAERPAPGEEAGLGALGTGLGDHAAAAVALLLAEPSAAAVVRSVELDGLGPHALRALEAEARLMQGIVLERLERLAREYRERDGDDRPASGRLSCGAFLLGDRAP